MPNRWWLVPALGLGSLLLASVFFVGFAVALAYPKLPSLEALTQYSPKVPLRIFSDDGLLIGEFGEERRAVVRIQEVPLPLRQAIIAAEDERFYEHGGIDYVGILRAVLANFTAGEAKQGASTITMQVARNFFLSSERTFSRKFNEALLAFKIEHSLAKDQILELYVNQIYLGQRAYGFAAAAQAYFGRNLRDLSISEMAMLAGLPKAPSKYNPVVNRQRATQRQHYVLRRMLELKFITLAQHKQAVAEPLRVRKEQSGDSTHADHFNEMIRQAVYDQYREKTYTHGIRVFTTLNKEHQEAAYLAVRKGVLDYDRRHGYRGAEGFQELPQDSAEDDLEDFLQDWEDSDDLRVALVLEANPKSLKAYLKGGETIEIGADALKLAKPYLNDKASANKRIRRGAFIRVRKNEKEVWELAQIPLVEAGLVGMDPESGSIRALVGGFDYLRNKYNHVTQSQRQPGSSFKPFIYSAALEKGFTPATIINDAPLSFDSAETGSASWEPKNFDGTYDGPIRMRVALTKSKNLVSIRILRAIGTQYAQDYITRFGFDAKHHPAYLPMALGAGSVTPLELATGYSVFANSGYRVSPFFISRVEDSEGKVLSRAQPARAGGGAPQAIDPRNAFVMFSMMQDVIRGGTGARALQLGRGDIAGKTGTTNDQMDAWFAGFQKRLTAVAWMGFDTPRSLGSNETGSQAALPIWITYMGAALKNIPQELPTMPNGVVVARVNPDTGLHEEQGTGSIMDYFYHENLPPEADGAPGNAVGITPKPSDDKQGELY
ncbi:MAG: penicillin-binding protein 1A [Betaproteobacteria bacterium]|nr:penicillin-binding protein 1A [Betaproteobacteria bacterium]